MKLNLDVAGKTFTVADDPAPKLDGRGKHRQQKRTGYPLWTTQLFVRDEYGGSVIDVVTASPTVPGLKPDDRVAVVGMYAVEWQAEGKSGVVLHADRIEPLDEPPE